jgi:RNA-directed DNA polymerase
MPKTLYDKVRSRPVLENAWRIVHSNGITSKSKLTRQQVKEFSIQSNKHINRIVRQLRERKFKFQASEGILQVKPGKDSKRPIVISPIENRIVQRAILDVLQSHRPLQKYFKIETSFGGIKDRSVSDALRMLYENMQTDGKFFARSDIKSFFTKIPKPTILNIISGTTSDEQFLSLFSEAISVELSNLNELGKDKNAFPIYDIGVAQGSCLSPLLGNILLYEFDRELNKGDITCIRYIDDFIILGPNINAIKRSLKHANSILEKHNLCIYDPNENKEKAEIGPTVNMFSFLGCDIRPGMIRPTKRSQKRLLKNIDEVFADSMKLMAKPEILIRKHAALSQTFLDISNIMKGWGNQYSFCNDIKLMESLDEKVDERISRYLSVYSKYKNLYAKRNENDNRRRLLGVHLLTDSKSEPIIS